jgi:bifunctional polynucleotide phosphatase/kinase
VITTKSGKKFPRDAEDWKWTSDGVVDRITKFAKSSGSAVFLVSNQKGLRGKRGAGEAAFKTKIAAIFRKIPPYPVFVPTEGDAYRKPSPLIFERWIAPHISPKCHVMYVGDAAGRPGDFSDSDRGFAHNIALRLRNDSSLVPGFSGKVSFKTPEEFFEGAAKTPFKWRGFAPQTYLDRFRDFATPSVTLPSDRPIAVMMMGPAASGKSSLAQSIATELGDAKTISQDEFKTKAPRLVRETLTARKSVVIDNTHYTKAQRAKYLTICSELDIPVVCVMALAYSAPGVEFDLESKTGRLEQVAIAKHLNMMRVKRAARAGASSTVIPDVAYNMYVSKFEHPSASEGFVEILKHPFVPRFDSPIELADFLERT